MQDATRTRHANGTKPRRTSASAAVEQAKAHLLELTGRQPETVSSLSRGEDGWEVVLEVVELERIPHSTDILGSYHMTVDDGGELMQYQRIARYYRNQSGGER
jgi:hypothetical protein